MGGGRTHPLPLLIPHHRRWESTWHGLCRLRRHRHGNTTFMTRTGDAVGVVLRDLAEHLGGGHEGGAVPLGQRKGEVVDELRWRGGGKE